jgi:hypothetical protein
MATPGSFCLRFVFLFFIFIYISLFSLLILTDKENGCARLACYWPLPWQQEIYTKQVPCFDRPIANGFMNKVAHSGNETEQCRRDKT